MGSFSLDLGAALPGFTCGPVLGPPQDSRGCCGLRPRMLCLQATREVDRTRRGREHGNMSRHFVKVLPQLLSKVPSGEGPWLGPGRLWELKGKPGGCRSVGRPGRLPVMPALWTVCSGQGEGDPPPADPPVLQPGGVRQGRPGLGESHTPPEASLLPEFRPQGPRPPPPPPPGFRRGAPGHHGVCPHALPFP